MNILNLHFNSMVQLPERNEINDKAQFIVIGRYEFGATICPFKYELTKLITPLPKRIWKFDLPVDFIAHAWAVLPSAND